MRIGIDARLYGTKHGGIGRYAQKLIEELEKTDQNNQYVVFLQTDGFDAYRPQNPNFQKVRADFRAYSLGEQLLFPSLLSKYKLDLVHFTHFNAPIFYGGKFVVTIHDLIISHYPTSRATTLNPLVYQIKLKAYDFLVKAVARKAIKIISVSDYTKQDIVKLLKIKPDKIQTIYEGVDLPAVSGQTSNDVLERLGLAGDFVMYVGSAYPHKNLEKLIEAFAIIAAKYPELKLVLAGRKNFFYERLAGTVDEKLKDKIVFTGYLSDEDLAVLYRRAKLYVFPSLIEGFGLPPLEAQYYGLPVASSNATCLPEILGDSAVYFDPNSAADMAEKISATLADDALRQKLIAAGRENLKKYSWTKMAEEISAIYKNV